MSDTKFLVSSTPHIRKPLSGNMCDLITILSLLPAIICSVIFFKFRAFLIIAVALLSCYITDIFFSFIILGKFSFSDLTGVITGLILGCIMPIGVPIYYVIIAGFLSVVISKVLFGGRGKDLINGASLGHCIIAACLGGFTTTLVAFGDILSPLAMFQLSGYSSVSTMDLLLGNAGGLIGTTCIYAVLLGGIILCLFKVYDFYIPLISIISFAVSTFAFNGINAVVPEMLAGSFLFASFFMLPSHSSSPALWPSKILYSILFGFLAAFVRTNYLFGEAGVFFCLILCNVLAPGFDFFVSMLFTGRGVKKYE